MPSWEQMSGCGRCKEVWQWLNTALRGWCSARQQAADGQACMAGLRLTTGDPSVCGRVQPLTYVRHPQTSLVLCQGAASRLKQEVAELLETLLRLHAAHSDAAAEEDDSATGNFREAATSQLPLLLSAYGALIATSCAVHTRI